MTDKQYDDAILDSNAIDPTDVDGNPIPVTIPIMLAPGVKVVYTTRLGGTSEGDYAHCNLGGKSGDDPNHVLANRVALSNAINAKLSLVSQVHSGIAVDVDESFVMNRPFGFDVSGSKGENAQQMTETADEPAVVEADGQVTAQKNVALGMFAADCLPVLMADAEAGVIGAAHCGRRGLQNGVIGATIEKMVAKGAKPERIVATLGPCICGDCYEVGGDIADEFDAQFPGTFTLSRFGQPASILRPLRYRSLPRPEFQPTMSCLLAPASMRPPSIFPKMRNWRKSASPMAKVNRSSRNVLRKSAVACARWKIRSGSRIAVPPSQAKHTKAVCLR